MSQRFAPFVLCWATVALLSTWSPVPAPAAPAAGVTVRVDPLAGAAIEGRMLGLEGQALSLATAAGTRTVALDTLRRLTRRDEVERTLAGVDHLRVTLTGGELLHGTYAGATVDGLILQTPDLGRVAVLLDVVATVVAVPHDAGPCFEPELNHLPKDDDILYAQSGDEMAGIVLAIDDEGIEIETAARGRSRRVAWGDLLVLHLANDPAPPPAALRIEIETTEGSRLEVGGAVTTSGESLEFALRSAPGTRVQVPLSQVRVIRPSGGAFVYASTLPFESTFVDYYGDDQVNIERFFGARADRRPLGCPLRLAGRTYRHGFAVHSRSTVTIRTARAWKRFEVLFGVDDVALERPRGGVVDARVLGDGKVLWEAKDVRAGEEPRHIGPLDLSEVDVLVLEVDFGAEMLMRDRATWADPLLFR